MKADGQPSIWVVFTPRGKSPVNFSRSRGKEKNPWRCSAQPRSESRGLNSCGQVSAQTLCGYLAYSNTCSISPALNNSSFHSGLRWCDLSTLNNEGNYKTLTETVSNNRTLKFLVLMSSPYYILESFHCSVSGRTIKVSVSFYYWLKLEEKMAVIMVEMSQNKASVAASNVFKLLSPYKSNNMSKYYCENPSQDDQCPGQDLNTGPLEYEAGIITIKPRRPTRILLKSISPKYGVRKWPGFTRLRTQSSDGLLWKW
jgi:hypothetical protein